ncbi:MAG: hypothetical protein MUE50_22555, partial [Pirellulaceae bacterium]|nr:hypothetical protein [Pirellulaceae bacterium]
MSYVYRPRNSDRPGPAAGDPHPTRPAGLDHPVAQALARMLTDLPEGLRRLAQDQVGAIYLVQGNFGSARVEAMRDAQGRVFGGCILLN